MIIRLALPVMLLSALVAGCGEPVDQSQIEAPPAEAPPPKAADAVSEELVQAATPLDICLRGANNTVAIDACYAKELEDRVSELDRYVDAARERLTDVQLGPADFAEAHRKWQDFRDTYCASVGELWQDGTVRTSRTLSCRIDLTAQRAHHIWKDYLTREDAEPTLPEPPLG